MERKSNIPIGLWKVCEPVGKDLRYMLVHLQIARCAVGMLGRGTYEEQAEFYHLISKHLPPVNMKVTYTVGERKKGTRNIRRDPFALLLNEKINSESFDHRSLQIDAGSKTIYRNTESLIYYSMCMGVFNGRRVGEEFQRRAQGRTNLKRPSVAQLIRETLSSLTEEEVWTSSSKKRYRNSCVKTSPDQGRHDLRTLEEIDEIEIDLPDLYQLDRKEVSLFFWRNVGLAGQRCYSIFERCFDKKAQKPSFMKQSGALWGAGAAVDSQLVAGKFGCAKASWKFAAALNGWEDSKLESKRWKVALRHASEYWEPINSHMAQAASLLENSSDAGKQFLSCEEGKMIRFIVTLNKKYRRFEDWKTVGSSQPEIQEETLSDFSDDS